MATYEHWIIGFDSGGTMFYLRQPPGKQLLRDHVTPAKKDAYQILITQDHEAIAKYDWEDAHNLMARLTGISPYPWKFIRTD